MSNPDPWVSADWYQSLLNTVQGMSNGGDQAQTQQQDPSLQLEPPPADYQEPQSQPLDQLQGPPAPPQVPVQGPPSPDQLQPPPEQSSSTALPFGLQLPPDFNQQVEQGFGMAAGPGGQFLRDIFGRPIQQQGQQLLNIPAQTQELISRADSGSQPIEDAKQGLGQALAAVNPFSDLTAQQRAEQGVTGLATGIQKTWEAAGNPSVNGPLAYVNRYNQSVLKALADVTFTAFMIASPAAERLLGRLAQTTPATRDLLAQTVEHLTTGEITPDQQYVLGYNNFRNAVPADVQARIDDYAASTAYSGARTHLAGAQAIANGMPVNQAISQYQDTAAEMLGQSVLNPEVLVHPILNKAGISHDTGIARQVTSNFSTPVDETAAETGARMAARGDLSTSRPLIYNLARDEQRIALNDSREIVNQLMGSEATTTTTATTPAQQADWLFKFANGSLVDEHPLFADALNSPKGREARLLVQSIAARSEPDLSVEVMAKLSPGTQSWITTQRAAGAADADIYAHMQAGPKAIVDRLSPIGEPDPMILQKMIGTATTSEEAMARLTAHLGNAVERLIPANAPGRLQGPINTLKNLAHWGYIASSPAILVHKFANDVEGMLADHLFTTAPLEDINRYNASYGFNVNEAHGLRGYAPGIGEGATGTPQTAAQIVGGLLRRPSASAVSDVLGKMTTNFRARMISEGIRQSVEVSSRNSVERFTRLFPDAARFPPAAQQLMREELRNNLTEGNLARVSKLVRSQYPEAFTDYRPPVAPPSGEAGVPPVVAPLPRPPSPNGNLHVDPDALDPGQRASVAAVRELETMPEGERIKAEVANAQTLSPEMKAAELAHIQSEEATAHQVRADLAAQARKEAFIEANTPHPVEPPPVADAPSPIEAAGAADAANFEQELAQHKALLNDAMSRSEPDVKAFTNATTRLEGEKLKLWDEGYYQPVDAAYKRAAALPYGPVRDTAWRDAMEMRTKSNLAVHVAAMVRADDYFAAHNGGSHVDGPIDRFGKEYGLIANDAPNVNEIRAKLDARFGQYTRDATAARYPDAPVPEPVKPYEPVAARAEPAVPAQGMSRPLPRTADRIILDDKTWRGGWAHFVNAINADRVEAGRTDLLTVPKTGAAPGAWRDATRGATLEEGLATIQKRTTAPASLPENTARAARPQLHLTPEAAIAARGLSPEDLRHATLTAIEPDGTIHHLTGDASELAQREPGANAPVGEAAGGNAVPAPAGGAAGGEAGQPPGDTEPVAAGGATRRAPESDQPAAALPQPAPGAAAAERAGQPAKEAQAVVRPLTRARYEQQLLATANQVGIPPAQARAQIALMNTAVDNIARLTGKSVDEVYGKYIAGVSDKFPETRAILEQTGDGLRDRIANAVQGNFDGIVERMKASGALRVEC